ncbi:DUF493 family protein [Apibacter muscae]|uniref:DUF493 family protein n=1 Tax=Apibacter muscae TaxID=2509004 RepID=UPI0011AC5102|nr:DUF493 family protein [Apibacter muscae]TWP30026.1 DUF493 family protein [Apibacter muscae]
MSNNEINSKDINNKNSEEFYDKLKIQLDESNTLPGKYMFKFIVPTESSKIAKIQKIFEFASPTFSMRESKNNKYTSISVNIYAVDSTSIINYYKEVSLIEGVMML